MNYEPKSIEEQITCLANLTGAPLSFVEQVRALFTTKGIPLDTDATPFLKALEEAFRREENIRASSVRARDHVVKLRENFRKVGRAYVDQLSQLRRLQGSLKRQSSKLKSQAAKDTSSGTRVTIPGDHRTLVVRTEREQLPLVPGPEDVQ